MIREITVVGGEKIGTSQIREQSGLRVGQPWDDAARRAAQRGLLEHAWIDEACVKAERSPQGLTVRISVSERNPFGIVALDAGGPFWVDREGFVLGQAEQPPGVPAVTGIDARLTPTGKRIAPRGAIRVVREFFSLPGRVLARFRSLRYRERDLVLEARAGWQALLPQGSLTQALDRLDRVRGALSSGDGHDGKWRTIDLRFDGEVIVGR